MESSSSYLKYKDFERALKDFTRIIPSEEGEPGKTLPKIICSRAVAEMVADKPYRVVYYHDAPIYLLILCRNKVKGNEGDIGFAFYDDQHGFFEGEVADFLMNQPKLRIRELQVRATVGLEETLKETEKPGLAGSGSKQN